jgi:hypothetical protein
MNVIAIDPGVGGGIGKFTITDGIMAAKMPDGVNAIWDAIPSGGGVAYIEDVPKYCGGKIASSSTAVLFRNFGRVEGLLTALGWRVILVPPKEWQARLNLGGRKSVDSQPAWKRKLKEEAERRFPNESVTLATADALLILDYALELEGIER